MTAAFFPIQQQWRRLKPLFEQPEVLELMHEEMECYAKARAEDDHLEYRPKPFSLDLRPESYDSLDWRYNTSRNRRGRRPAFFEWCCAGACHWIASHNLMVISALEPDRPWQIAHSDKHSTVVDLERKLLFDPNFQAFNLTAEEAWKEAVDWHNTEILPVGIYMNHAGAAK